MKVMKSVHHLMEVGPGDSFRELASISHKVEELTSADIFEYDGEATVGSLISLLVGGVFPNADKFDQVLMVEGFHDGQLMLEGVEGGCFLLVFLDGHKSSLLVFT
jgi:hypothetical protein